MQASLSFPLFSLLLVIGHGLQCEYCSSKSGSCVGVPHICQGSENACLILTMENVVGNQRWLVTYKGCTKARNCPPSPVSFTFPSQRKRISAKCCQKDLCNNGVVKVSRRGSRPNGLRCTTCFSANPHCQSIKMLQCNGQERKCISYTVTIEEGDEVNVYAKGGCGTRHACTNKTVNFGVLGMYTEHWKEPKCSRPLKVLCIPKTMQVALICYLFSTLLATGMCLQCEHCISSTNSCTSTPHVCKKSENACLTQTIETTKGKEKHLVTYKGCTKLRHCPPSPMSFTFPSERKRSAARCCRKDLCNREAVTLPRLGIRLNGLKCPGCFSKDPKCIPTEIINCNGWEFNCVYYDVSVEQDGKIYTYAKRGCGTVHACMNDPRILGVPGLYMETVKNPQCTPAPRILGKFG
ncbi:phospholipase A2 inhibitor and Ly6/PLAUR domain-containing protein, partial [Varanus komodoensis]